MNRLCVLVSATAVALGIGTAYAAESANAMFKDAKGKRIGTAKLMQTPNGVLIDVDVSGIPPGEHAFHFHETGRCDSADGFKSAGAHFAGDASKHGFKVEGGPHAGDMMNQFVASDGKLRAHVVNTRISLGSGADSLFDKDGTSMIVHAKGDDYKSQPSGDAGGRIACAVVERSAGSETGQPAPSQQ